MFIFLTLNHVFFWWGGYYDGLKHVTAPSSNDYPRARSCPMENSDSPSQSYVMMPLGARAII